LDQLVRSANSKESLSQCMSLWRTREQMLMSRSRVGELGVVDAVKATRRQKAPYIPSRKARLRKQRPSFVNTSTN
jgi:hypothetical protein